MNHPLTSRRLPVSAGLLLGVGAAGLAALAINIAGVDLLWVHSQLQWRTPVLIALAIGAHLLRRSSPSVSVAVLHLAAVGSCITDLMATGSWAMGWGPLAHVNDWLTLLNLCVISVSTGFALARIEPEARLLTKVALLAVASGIAGTALGRQPLPPLAWALFGSVIGFMALIWALELSRAVVRRGPAAFDWPARLDVILALWVFAAAATISVLVFEGIPHVPDETAYLFHAKYFAEGRLFLPVPPDVAAFELMHTLDDNGRWYSIFPPGWPAVLALGVRAGIPTLLNPLLAAATILLLFRILTRLYGRRVATLACTLLALSPEFLLMSAGLMSHPLAVVCTLVAAYAMLRAETSKPFDWAALGGLALGLLALTRLFEAALVVAAFAVYFLSQKPWQSRQRVLTVCVFYCVSLIGPVATLLYQQQLTGNAFADPITKYFDRHFYPGSNRLGFGPSIANLGWANDMLPGHSPLEAALHVQLNTQLVDTELFGWPFGSLVALLLFIAWRKRLWQRADLLFVCLIAFPIIGQAFYWYSGADFGARYWYQIVVPCVVLSARALTSDFAERYRLRRVAVLASVCGLLVFLPWRAATKYHNYRGVGDSVRRLAQTCDMRRGLVLVRGAAGANDSPKYASAAFLNEASLGGEPPVFAREVSADATARMRAAWPARPLWVIEVPDDPRGNARVIERPVNAPECMAAPVEVP